MESVIVETPMMRAKITTIIGAISAFGIVNVKVRQSYEATSKETKVTMRIHVIKTKGTVTGHYFNFIANIFDVMDRQDEFKGFYLVTDNVPIHTHDDIGRYIASIGYGCMYLSPYSPEF